MEKKQGLTARQQQVFDFIAQYVRESSKPPTFREIGEEFAIKSTNGVRSLLTALEKKGFLKVFPRISRGIQILVDTLEEPIMDGAARIPVLGHISAGKPLLAEENYSGTLVVDSALAGRPESTFALKVRGDSMVGAGILQDDFVIVSQSQDIRSGDIVAAMLDSDATVKRFVKEDGRVLLKAENEKYPPIVVGPETADFRIAGKVVAVLRKY